MINYVIGLVIVGLAVLALRRVLRSLKQGECAGCSGCDSAANCGKRQ